MERAFGRSFADVEAVTGARDVNVALGAEAVTDGRRIAFRDEHPRTETVAHELAHVVQADGKSGRMDQLAGGGLERGADDAAAHVASGWRVDVAPGTSVPDGLLRKEDPSAEHLGAELEVLKIPIIEKGRFEGSLSVTLSRVGAGPLAKVGAKAGQVDADVEIIKPTLELSGRRAAAALVSGDVDIETRYPGISIHVEPSGPEASAGSEGIEVALAKFTIRAEWKSTYPVGSGAIEAALNLQLEVDVSPADAKTLTRILRTHDAIQQERRAIEGTLDRLEQLAGEREKVRARLRELDEIPKPSRANLAEREMLRARRAALSEQIVGHARDLKKRQRTLRRLGEQLGKISSAVKGTVAKAIVRMLGRQLASQLARLMARLAPWLNILALLMDLVELIMALAEIAKHGVGFMGRGGGSGGDGRFDDGDGGDFEKGEGGEGAGSPRQGEGRGAVVGGQVLPGGVAGGTEDMPAGGEVDPRTTELVGIFRRTDTFQPGGGDLAALDAAVRAIDPTPTEMNALVARLKTMEDREAARADMAATVRDIVGAIRSHAAKAASPAPRVRTPSPRKTDEAPPKVTQQAPPSHDLIGLTADDAARGIHGNRDTGVLFLDPSWVDAWWTPNDRDPLLYPGPDGLYQLGGPPRLAPAPVRLKDGWVVSIKFTLVRQDGERRLEKIETYTFHVGDDRMTVDAQGFDWIVLMDYVDVLPNGELSTDRATRARVQTGGLSVVVEVLKSPRPAGPGMTRFAVILTVETLPPGIEQIWDPGNTRFIPVSVGGRVAIDIDLPVARR